jgi:ABC-type lipoprotein export system ATPase subunit
LHKRIPSSYHARVGSTTGPETITFRSIRPRSFPFREDSELWSKEVTVRKGETVLIRGPSGSGKSTALGIAIGSRADFDGQVLYDDGVAGSLSDAGRSAVLREGIAVVFQDFKLIPGFTVRENMELKRLLSPMKTEEEALEMLERLGVGRVRDKPVSTLSRGEQQRVAVVRALVQPFSFLLLDEPFSHLDAASARETRLLIEEERAAREAAVLLFNLDEFPGLERRIAL